MIVEHAEKIGLTGKKWYEKEYFTHSKHPGSEKFIPITRMRERDCTEVSTNVTMEPNLTIDCQTSGERNDGAQFVAKEENGEIDGVPRCSAACYTSECLDDVEDPRDRGAAAQGKGDTGANVEIRRSKGGEALESDRVGRRRCTTLCMYRIIHIQLSAQTFC